MVALNPGSVKPFREIHQDYSNLVRQAHCFHEMLEHKIDFIDFMLQHLVKTVSLPHEIGDESGMVKEVTDKSRERLYNSSVSWGVLVNNH